MRCCRWEQLLRRLNIGTDSIQRCVAAELLYRKQAAMLATEFKDLQQQLDALVANHNINVDFGRTPEELEQELARKTSRSKAPATAAAAAAAAAVSQTAASLPTNISVSSFEWERVTLALRGNLEKQLVLMTEHCCYCVVKALTPIEAAQVRGGLVRAVRQCKPTLCPCSSLLAVSWCLKCREQRC